MHSYAAEAEGGSETDTGSDMGVTGATGCDMEADTKPDAMSDNNPVAVPVPTNMMRNSKNKEFRTKTITKVAILNDTYKPKAVSKSLTLRQDA